MNVGRFRVISEIAGKVEYQFFDYALDAILCYHGKTHLCLTGSTDHVILYMYDILIKAHCA